MFLAKDDRMPFSICLVGFIQPSSKSRIRREDLLSHQAGVILLKVMMLILYENFSFRDEQ